MLTSRLTLEGPLFSEKTSFIVGGRTTYSDWILKKLPEKSGYKDGNAGFYDLNATINHKFDERNNLYLNGYYSHDRFRFNVDERYAYENANASVKWSISSRIVSRESSPLATTIMATIPVIRITR